MTNIQTIPLNKLTPWDGNVRKTAATDGIGELAASIAAHGLLQSLVVKKAGRGKYAVIAGGRRLLALKALAKDGRIDKDHGVTCRIADGDIDPAEISLAENVVRAPMHPADQFDAFRGLIDGGASVADVAARFGIAESTVTKRLKLGRLSPVILASYRAGDIGLEEAQAFALSDDHEAQQRVFEQLSVWQMSPQAIRSALIEDEIPASDKRVRFVGLDVYEAQGGPVRRDLFDPEDGGYVQDTALLDRLAAAKLEIVGVEVREEGWKWVEAHVEFDYEQQSQFGRVHAERVPLSEADEAALEQLTAQYDELAEQAEADPDDADLAEKLDQIDAQIDAINESGYAYTAEALAQAGAVVTLAHDGSVDIKRGLVLPEDARKAKAASKSASKDKPQGVILSAKLTEDLTAQKSAAIAAELLQQPDVALTTVVHAMTLGALYRYAGDDTCLQLRLTPPLVQRYMAKPETSRGIAALDHARSQWQDRLPENPAVLWDWCIAQTQATLLELLSFVAANAIDTVHHKQDRDDSPRLRHGNDLARALQFDMALWFMPGADNFFGRISRDAILAALTEANGSAPAPTWTRMKKAELAALAEREIAGNGWLPAPMRIAETVANGLADATPETGDAATLAEAAE